MRVFLTGATGFIGSRILPELLALGHEVIGTTRSDAGAEAITAAGGTPFHATLEDPAGLAAGAEEADAVIHTAFDHNFANFEANCDKDRRVIEALGTVLKGSDRPLMITSGTGMGDAGDGQPAREDVCNFHHPNPRIASELAGEALLQAGMNVSVMRLPQVHDTERQGLITSYIQIALQTGKLGYVGEGMNRWPAAHVSDVARLYAMAIGMTEPGMRFHAVAEEGITARAIAGVLAQGLGLPVVSVPAEEAPVQFGWLAGLLALDMAASSALTRARTGWKPTGPDLLSDLRGMDYARILAG